MKDNEVRVDLHVHVDGKINKENVIKSLQKAEADGVKKLCLLEHSSLDVMDPIIEILKEGTLRDYYSGDLIIGCEYDNIINAHHINPDGTNYDGFISHILVYMPLEDALKVRRNKTLHARNFEKDYEQDYQKLVERIEAMGLPVPTMEELKEQGKPHIVKDLQNWVVQTPERRDLWLHTLNVDSRVIDYPSDFIRNLAQNPNGALFYKPEAVPYSSQLFEIIRLQSKNAKVVLAHPAYMQPNFNTEYYLDTMMSFEETSPFKTFDGIEVCYYLNKKYEQDFIEKYADDRNFIKTAGSDSIKVEGEMYYLAPDDCKYFFVPELGNALGTSFDIGNVEITEDKEESKLKIKSANGGSPLVADKDLFEDIKVNEKEAINAIEKDEKLDNKKEAAFGE